MLDALLNAQVPLWVLSQQAAPSGIEGTFLQYGLLGVLVLVAGAAIRKFMTEQRADLIEARNQRDALIKDLFDLVIPAVSKTADLLQRVEKRLEEEGS